VIFEMNNESRIPTREFIDIEKLRSDLISMCLEILNNIEPYSQVDEFKPVMEYISTRDKKYFQELFGLHNDLVSWLQKKQSLLLKAGTVQELFTIYWHISNGFQNKQEQINDLLRESIKESRDRLSKIQSRHRFSPD